MSTSMTYPGRHHFREIFYKTLKCRFYKCRIRKVSNIKICSCKIDGTLLLYLSTVFVAMASLPLVPPPVMIKVSPSSIPHPRLKVQTRAEIYFKKCNLLNKSVEAENITLVTSIWLHKSNVFAVVTSHKKNALRCYQADMISLQGKIL